VPTLFTKLSFFHLITPIFNSWKFSSVQTLSNKLSHLCLQFRRPLIDPKWLEHLRGWLDRQSSYRFHWSKWSGCCIQFLKTNLDFLWIQCLCLIFGIMLKIAINQNFLGFFRFIFWGPNKLPKKWKEISDLNS
jgi:hypothetical protein